MEEMKMQKRIFRGKGTLKEFQIEYTELVMTEGCHPHASNIFPVLKQGSSLMNDNEEPLYEWVIWYNFDETTKSEIDLKTGNVVPKKTGLKIEMTDKEGKSIIQAKKEEELVI